MPSVTKSIRIEAPVKVVFNVVTEPDNWTRYAGSLVEVSDRSPNLPARGSTFGWKYRMMGFSISGQGVVSEHEPFERFDLTMDGRFPVRESFRFLPDGGVATVLEVTIHYEMPEPMMLILGEAVTEKLNEIEARGTLEKIKTLCESSADAGGFEPGRETIV